MLGEHLDAPCAGYRVDYEDASPFSREYKRLLGQPQIDCRSAIHRPDTIEMMFDLSCWEGYTTG